MARRDRETIGAGLDSILPPADLMGDIIASDRQRSGRAAETASPEGVNSASNEVIKLNSFEAMNPGSNEHTKEASKETAKPQRKASAKLPPKPRTKEASKEDGKGASRLSWREDVLDRTREGGGDGRRVRMNVDIEDELHLRMKMWCLSNGCKLNEIIPALMAAFLDEDEV